MRAAREHAGMHIPYRPGAPIPYHGAPRSGWGLKASVGPAGPTPWLGLGKALDGGAAVCFGAYSRSAREDGISGLDANGISGQRAGIEAADYLRPGRTRTTRTSASRSASTARARPSASATTLAPPYVRPRHLPCEMT